MEITLQRLLDGTSNDSFEDGIRLDSVLEPIGGSGATVKPSIYSGAVYQADRRWPPADDPQGGGEKPQDIYVIDNVPSQANRYEDALRRSRSDTGVPEMILDLSDLPSLPPHLPRELSSWQFPHRNADAYLRDSTLEGVDFSSHPTGRSVLDATHDRAAALMAWWPQALLYGFWQSHLGKKRNQAKHARAWASEIIGWQPASSDTKILGLKGDPLNLSIEESAIYDDKDHEGWRLGAKPEKGEVKKALSELGHGQVPVGGATPAAVSFRRLTQRATVSFAQLRRIGLGPDYDTAADAAARALLVAMGLHAHCLAFGRGFTLRSGSDLRVSSSSALWLGLSDESLDPLNHQATRELLESAKQHASSVGVPLDGWDRDPIKLSPKDNIAKAIESSWPLAEES
ncbi:MAG: type I-U CRISPR-associated RAMP protein Csb1/Cas7u [Acidimicrobiaceae bacterium]|nr:type I-U CRISPR-associated RAMP protein Csb1/Cas7u [Acidimicrobiaceae bacterium]MCY4294770.1 type I-U CRISPR-associated RAMP protein Csb1/Cas7u [Acidimicrobiaceae bacterium]